MQATASLRRDIRDKRTANPALSPARRCRARSTSRVSGHIGWGRERNRSPTILPPARRRSRRRRVHRRGNKHHSCVGNGLMTNILVYSAVSPGSSSRPALGPGSFGVEPVEQGNLFGRDGRFADAQPKRPPRWLCKPGAGCGRGGSGRRRPVTTGKPRGLSTFVGKPYARIGANPQSGVPCIHRRAATPHSGILAGRCGPAGSDIARQAWSSGRMVFI